MQWSEVRTLFPNSFVLVEDQRSHIENDEWHVDEVAVIRSLHDGKEARKRQIAPTLRWRL